MVADLAGADSATLLSQRTKAVPSGEMVEHMAAVTLNARQVTKTVSRNLRPLQYCYRRSVARGTVIAGYTTLHIVIEPRGGVSSVEVRATGKRISPLKSCMASQVRRWKFPAADAPTIVNYPIVFNTASGN